MEWRLVTNARVAVENSRFSDRNVGFTKAIVVKKVPNKRVRSSPNLANSRFCLRYKRSVAPPSKLRREIKRYPVTPKVHFENW